MRNSNNLIQRKIQNPNRVMYYSIGGDQCADLATKLQPLTQQKYLLHIFNISL